ncbi:MAG TPA: hypothetical protein VF867_16115 [Arthrobacter sp.]
MKTSAVALTALASLLLAVSLSACAGPADAVEAPAAAAPAVYSQPAPGALAGAQVAPGALPISGGTAADSVGTAALAQLATIPVKQTAQQATAGQRASFTADAAIVKPAAASVASVKCAEAKAETALKAHFGLAMTQAEHDRIAAVLVTCS